MGMSSVSGLTPDEQPKKVGGEDKLDKQGVQGKKEREQITSIWDTNNDGTVSVEEQKEAVNKAIENDNAITVAKALGFDPQPFVNDLESQFEEIVLSSPKTIGESVQTLVENANNKVQGYIDTIRTNAEDYVREFLNGKLGEMSKGISKMFHPNDNNSKENITGKTSFEGALLYAKSLEDKYACKPTGMTENDRLEVQNAYLRAMQIKQ